MYNQVLGQKLGKGKKGKAWILDIALLTGS